MGDIYINSSTAVQQLLLGLDNPYLGAPIIALPANLTISESTSGGVTMLYFEITS